MVSPQPPQDSFTIDTRESMSGRDFIASLEKLSACAHRLLQVAIANGTRANDPEFQALTICAGNANIAAFHANQAARSAVLGQPRPLSEFKM